jgi:hypothetical protein
VFFYDSTVLLGNGLLLKPNVIVNGVEWRAGSTTWILWPDTLPQERVCIGVGNKGRTPCAYLVRGDESGGPARGDTEVVCWPLRKLVLTLCFFFPVTQSVTQTF